jgi:hypothetical protein
MKTVTITRREIEKARKANPTIIPASERPWSRPAVFKSKKSYSRKGRQQMDD